HRVVLGAGGVPGSDHDRAAGGPGGGVGLAAGRTPSAGRGGVAGAHRPRTGQPLAAALGRVVAGRARSSTPARRGRAGLVAGSVAADPGPDDPYPIADAHTRTDAADCVRRALAAEAIALRVAGEARRTPWGWEVAVVLRSGTPAGIVSKAGNLETHLDLPAGG